MATDVVADPGHRVVDATDHERLAEPRHGALPGADAIARLRLRLQATDLLAIVLALVTTHVVRTPVGIPGGIVTSVTADIAITVGWLTTLQLADSYEYRFLGSGVTEYKRVLTSSLQFFGLLLAGAYLLRVESSRAYILVVLPLGLLLLLVGRQINRSALLRGRRRGQYRSRVLVVGDAGPAFSVAENLVRDEANGYDVVGLAVPEGPVHRSLNSPYPLTKIDRVVETVDTDNVDVVAIAASEQMHHEDLNRLAWQLEGKAVDLVISPALLNVAGPRIRVRPVGGAPLLYIDEPRLSGPSRLSKRVFDIVGSLTGLLLMAVPMAACALAIKVSSPGPVFFRQWRVGKDGEMFRIFKLRTMVVDAHERQGEFAGLSHANGLLWKADNDPRITRVGAFLRKTSLDEFPQLINVLRGEMSLVGPRPLAVDPTSFGDHEHRRHLVRPGITGLWQVEARSEQNWEDAVRLDLTYVDNWSIPLDFAILARTSVAVLRGA